MVWGERQSPARLVIWQLNAVAMTNLLDWTVLITFVSYELLVFLSWQMTNGLSEIFITFFLIDLSMLCPSLVICKLARGLDDLIPLLKCQAVGWSSKAIGYFPMEFWTQASRDAQLHHYVYLWSVQPTKLFVYQNGQAATQNWVVLKLDCVGLIKSDMVLIITYYIY